jgi:hypothetical protein
MEAGHRAFGNRIKEGLINQTPIQEKPNVYIRRIKTGQFIDIFKKVGLMNQAPTKYKGVLINQAPTEEGS